MALCQCYNAHTHTFTHFLNLSRCSNTETKNISAVQLNFSFTWKAARVSAIDGKSCLFWGRERASSQWSNRLEQTAVSNAVLEIAKMPQQGLALNFCVHTNNQFYMSKMENAGQFKKKIKMISSTCDARDICHLDVQGLIHPLFLQLIEERVLQGLWPSQLLCSVAAFLLLSCDLRMLYVSNIVPVHPRWICWKEITNMGINADFYCPEWHKNENTWVRETFSSDR